MRARNGKAVACCLTLLRISAAARTVTQTITTDTCPNPGLSGSNGVGGYTTTDASGITVSGYVSQYTTTDSAGKTVTGVTSVPFGSSSGVSSTTASSVGSSDSSSEVALTSTISTTDSIGLPTLLTTTTRTRRRSSTRTGRSTDSGATSSTAAAGTSSAAASSTSSAPGLNPSAPCPGAALGTIANSGGQQWQVFCETDFYYNDLSSVAASTLDGCLSACAQYIPPDVGDSLGPPCVAVTWTLSNPFGANCYLKGGITLVQYGAPQYVSAKLVSYNPPAGSVSLLPPLQSATAAAVTTASTGGGVASTDGGAAGAGTSVVVSTAVVSPVPQSTASTATSPYISNPVLPPPPPSTTAGAGGTGTGSTAVATSSLVAAGEPALSPCPLADASLWAAGSASFNVSCGVALVGDTLTTTTSPSLEECMDACQSFTPLLVFPPANSTCSGVTFDVLAPVGQKCSLHGPDYSIGAASGVASGELVVSP